MLTKKGLVQFLWLWMICGCSTSCGGKSADPNLTSIDSGASTFSVSSSIASGGSTYSVGGSIASGGSTYSVGGAATGAPMGGTSAAGGASGAGNIGCYPVVSTVDAGPLCGNGVVNVTSGEGCDDGNRLSGDGCSANCQVEPSWVCPTACRLCIITIVCGDGRVSPGELCDDGNLTAGDGCDDRCHVEPGWVCPSPGESCIAVGDCDAGCCGDAIAESPETCDDGINDGSYSGCTPDCRLAPHCGDGIVNGLEECDVGINDGSYGGCTPDCHLAPYCGDGVVNGPEECDDGANNGANNVPANLVCLAYCRRYHPQPP